MGSSTSKHARTGSSSAGYPRYEHRPLTSENQFRLLTLLPAKRKAPVVFTLENVDFHASSKKYCALSFNYGSTDRNKDVLVDEGGGKVSAIEVTNNCYEALVEIRDSNTNFPLWVSAICINQKTDTEEKAKEKNSQLQLMSYIYPEAHLVLCWLGPDDEEQTAGLAIQALELWANAGQSEKEKDDLPRLRLLDQAREDILRGGSDTTRALQRFFQRGWWERMWVVQETCVDLKNPPLLMCGPHRLSFDHLWMAFWTATRTVPSGDRAKIFGESVVNLLPLLRLYGADESVMKLSYVIAHVSSRKYGFPQDAIYGTLGLAARFTKGYPPPEVRLSADQVCIRYTRAMMQVDGSLHVLSHVSTTTHDKSELPSWAVKWYKLPADRSQIENGWGSLFQSTRGKVVELAKQGMDDRQLTLKGATVDTVKLVFDISSLSKQLKQIHKWKLLRKTLIQYVDDNLQQQLHETYGVTSHRQAEALFRTLCNDVFVSDDTQHSLSHRANELDRIYSQYIDYLQQTLASERNEQNLRALRAAMTYDGIAAYVHANFNFQEESSRETFDDETNTGPAFDVIDRAVVEGTGLALLRGERHLVVTGQGYLGFVPTSVVVGDDICLLYGSTVPIVLRPLADAQHCLLGDAYVHGMMFGELVAEAEAKEKWFHLV